MHMSLARKMFLPFRFEIWQKKRCNNPLRRCSYILGLLCVRENIVGIWLYLEETVDGQ